MWCSKLNLFVLKSLIEPIDILKQYPLIYIVSTEAERESGVAIVHGRHVTPIPIKSYKCEIARMCVQFACPFRVSEPNFFPPTQIQTEQLLPKALLVDPFF